MNQSNAPTQKKTIRQLVMEYFMHHPGQDLPHGTVVDWVADQWRQQGNSTPPRDPWRVIRRLHQEGWLIKVKKVSTAMNPKPPCRAVWTLLHQSKSK